MKKFYVLSLILSAAFCSQAQTEKGTWLLGGDITFTSYESSSYFSLNPNIGYFVINNLAVGLNASLTTGEGSTTWMLGPAARYYFTQATQGKPFVGAGFLVGGADGGSTSTGFGAEAGYALFLNKSIALELGINYNRIEEVDIIGAGIGLQIHFHK